MKHLSLSPLLLISGIALLIWAGLAWGIEIEVLKGGSLAHFLFWIQDCGALLLGGATLLALSLFAERSSAANWRWALNGRFMLGLILLFAWAAWVGRTWLFSDYALSRDEQVVEFASFALQHGRLGWPIPPEWMPYRRAIMPEFFSPFGADHVWTAAYLPLNAAFRAFWALLGDAGLAAPAFLVIGLVSLWRIAVRLFPDRPDAVAVAMLMALSSTQLLVTGMTPYAMTGHFALNMLWLALVLRGGALGHGAAGVVALVLAGLHQYHYPLPFLLPFLLWFALGRRWKVLAFHGVVLALTVLIWAKLWPHLLIDLYGAAADVRPSAGVADKMESLFGRLLEKWHPLLHLSRFLAWNNLLLVPLALIAVWRIDWRAALRGQSIILPLALGAFGMAALAMDQGYGWGYRYLHGYIGSFALLSGYGWIALRRPGGEVRGGLLAASLIAACVTGSFLMMRAYHYVAPFAASYRLMMESGADVVLVDPRDGRYVTDLVRGRDGAPLGQPVVMNIGMLSKERLDQLCEHYDIVVLDRSSFGPLGVPLSSWNSSFIADLREHMEQRGCGRTLVAPPTR